MPERVQYVPIRRIPYEERDRDAPKNTRKIYRLLRKKGYSKTDAKTQTKFLMDFTLTKLPFGEEYEQ